MDVLEAIEGRRSIRAFRDEDVSEEDVAKLIRAAMSAPSAGNIQPWEFVVVRESGIKRGLVEAASGQEFIGEAPVVIAVCANENLSCEGYFERGKTLYCIQDTAAAIENLLLVAYSLGLGTCWVGAFDEEKMREALHIPYGIRPIAIVPVGYPAESPLPRSERPMDQVVHYESFRIRRKSDLT